MGVLFDASSGGTSTAALLVAAVSLAFAASGVAYHLYAIRRGVYETARGERSLVLDETEQLAETRAARIRDLEHTIADLQRQIEDMGRHVEAIVATAADERRMIVAGVKALLAALERDLIAIPPDVDQALRRIRLWVFEGSR